MIQHYKIPITTYVRETVQSYNISIQAYEYDTTLQDSYYVREKCKVIIFLPEYKWIH